MTRQSLKKRNKSRARPSGKVKQSNSFPASYYRSNNNSPKRKRRNTVNEGKPNWMIPAAILVLIPVVLAAMHFGTIDEVEVLGLENSDDKNALKGQVYDQYRYLWQPYFNNFEFTEEVEQSGLVSATFEVSWLEQKLIVNPKPSEEEVSQDIVINWQSGEGVYGVNSHGFVADSSERQDLPKVKDESSLDIDIGDRVGPRSFIDFVVEIETSGVNVEQYRVIDTTRELYADTPDGYFVRFDTEGDPIIQIENANRVKSQADSIDEYIDVRIPFKAYYR